MRSWSYFVLASLALAGLGACGGEEPAEEMEMEGGMGMDMPMEMEGMHDMPMAGGMTPEMRAHMAAMRGAGADSAMAMMPMHRQRTANLLAQMNREMRDMNMPADAAWNATVDSLRQDLATMPELSPAEVEALLPDHLRRVERLVEMHARMME